MARILEKDAADPRLPPADAGDDRRSASRFTLLIRAAKLIADGREHLCVIRDASQTGVKLRLYGDIRAVESLELELGNGARFPVEPVWQEGDYAGFRFMEDVELSRLVETECGRFPNRRLRLKTELSARLSWGSREIEATITNVSQQGAGLTCEHHLMLSQLVRLEVAGRPEIYAKVRWRRAPNYGLVFEDTLSFDELAHFAAG